MFYYRSISRNHCPLTLFFLLVAWAVSGNAVNAQALAVDFLFLADTELVVAKPDMAVGDMHSNGTIVLAKGLGRKGPPTVYFSDLTALGDITINSNNTINGDVTSAAVVSIARKVTVNGMVAGNTDVDYVNLHKLIAEGGCERVFTAGGADVTVSPPGSDPPPLPPGSYGSLVVEAGATLQLTHNGTTGVYSFTYALVNNGATLKIDVSQGPVEINVETEIVVFKDVTMSLSGGNSKDVKVSTKENISIGDRSVILGQLFAAPYGYVNFAKGVHFRGSICAGSIFLAKPGVVALHHEPGPSKASPATATATEEEEVPSDYVLHQNYPNPFNPETRIRFGLPQASHVTLVVYDVLGREVRVLVDGVREVGTHEVVFEAGNLPSGTYVYRLDTPVGSFVQTMQLVK